MLDIHKTLVKELSLENPKEEICGLISKNNIFPCMNFSNDKVNYFQISNQDIKKVLDFGPITEIYHSHLKNSDFSQDDIYLSEKLNIPISLYSISNNEFKTYIPKGLQIPYSQRLFILGIFDCLTLVIDYYKKELNIQLNDIKDDLRYGGNWKSHITNIKNGGFLKKHLINQGFYETKDIKKHDILLIKPSGYNDAIHCAIYVDKGDILHHPINRYSLIEQYSYFYKDKTINILRHALL